MAAKAVPDRVVSELVRSAYGVRNLFRGFGFDRAKEPSVAPAQRWPIRSPHEFAEKIPLNHQRLAPPMRQVAHFCVT